MKSQQVKLASAVLILSLGAWLIYHSTRPSPEAKVWDTMAKSAGIDPILWGKVGPILTSGSEGRCQEVSTAEYALLAKALETGNPEAQNPAMMVLVNCPPPNGAFWYAKLHAIGLHAKDEANTMFEIGRAHV